MKSVFAKNIEAINDAVSQEDFQFIPEDTYTGNIVKADFEKLKEFEQVALQVGQDLDSIVGRNDVVGLVRMAEIVTPYKRIAEKYEDSIPFARISIGKRLPLVNAATNSLDKAVELVANNICACFDEKQKAIDGIDDATQNIGVLAGLRAELDSAAESYKVLKKNFGSFSKAEIDKYVERMPRISVVKKELDVVADMLAEDQSKDNFVRLEQKRKRIKGGFFAGPVMAEACRLDYKEGRAKCTAFYDEIRAYVREFPKIWDKVEKIRKQNSLLEDGLRIIGSIDESELGAGVAKAISDVHYKLYSMPAPVDSGFTCIDRAREENIRLRTELQKQHSGVCNSLYARAKSVLEDISLPPVPESIEQLNVAFDYLHSSMQKISRMNPLLEVLGKKDLFNEGVKKHKQCSEVYEELGRSMEEYSVVEKAVAKCKQKLAEAAGLFVNPGFIEHDFNRALQFLDEKAPKLPETALFKKVTDEYISTASAMQKLVHERLTQGIGSLVEIYAMPIQLKGDIGADTEALSDRIDKINKTVMPLLSKNFGGKVPFTIDIYSARLKNAVQSFKAELSGIEQAKAQHDDLVRRIELMKEALADFDYARINGYSKWPVEIKPTPYTTGIVKEYCSIIEHLRSISGSKAVTHLSAFAHPAFDNIIPEK